MSHSDFIIKEGDNKPDLIVDLTDANGLVNLDGLDEVRFHMRPIEGPTVVVDAVAEALQTGSDPNYTNKGRVKYEFQAGDTDVPGRYYGEFELTYVSGEILTFPNDGHNPLIIEVTGQIA